MKKIASLVLVLALFISFLSGCNNSVSTQSDYSNNVIVEEIIIDNTSTVSSDEPMNDTVTSNVTLGDNSSMDNTSTNNSSTDNSNTNNSSVSNSSVVNPSTNNSSTDNSSTNNSFTGNPSIEKPSQNTSSKVDSANCLHSYDDGKIEQTAALFKTGIKKYTCTKCGDSFTGTYPVEKLKILAIGHSYSLNSMWKLYDICKAAGVKEIDIAIMYIAGCSLDAHWENAQNNAVSYELYRNNNGTWGIIKNYSIETIISEGGWDVITLQNSPGGAARENAFENLDNMVDYISGKCPSATLLWHMTWGFQNGSKWLDPTIYPKGEMQMYNGIISNVKQQVVPNSKIKGIVPVGTAIMNARTSSLKKEIHQEDGSHLSEDVGYYVGAVTWYMYLTGQSPYDFNYSVMTPSINKNIPMFIETAENAIKNPYQITKSRF